MLKQRTVETIKGFLGSKIGKIVTILVGLVSLGQLAANYAPIVKIGNTSYTYSDLVEYRSLSKKVAAIRGDKTVINYTSVFESLAAAAMEKEILDANNLSIKDKERVTAEVIAQSPYAGVLKKEKDKIGDERFYKLFVAPLVSDKNFASYYISKDPNRKVANEALQAAMTSGLQAAADKAGNKAVRINVPINSDTAGLVEEARKSIGTVITKYVEDGTGYTVIQPVEVAESHIVVDAVFIQRMAIPSFVEKELKSANVDMSSTFYSWFRVSDLRKEGRFLGPVKTAKKES